MEQTMITHAFPFIRRSTSHRWLAVAAIAAMMPSASLVIAVPLPAQPAGGPEKLKLVDGGTLTISEANSPTSVDISKDGQFVYMASFGSGTVDVFKRDAANGTLTRVQALAASEKLPLKGAVHIHLSPNNDYAAVSCFYDSSLVLFARDGKTGELSMLDALDRDSKLDGVPLFKLTSDAAWSPDGKFLCVGERDLNQIVAVQVADKKLKVVQAFAGTDDCFANVRGLWVSPDGKTLFAASPPAGCGRARGDGSGRRRDAEHSRDTQIRAR